MWDTPLLGLYIHTSKTGFDRVEVHANLLLCTCLLPVEASIELF